MRSLFSWTGGDSAHETRSTQILLQFQHPGVHRLPLLQSCPERPVQSILEIQLAAPRDDVGEQVAIKRGILFQECLEIERPLGRDQLIKPHLMRCDGGPLLLHKAMVRVWAGVPDTLEDHVATVGQLGGRSVALALRFGSDARLPVDVPTLCP